jgi:hypothetical protein
MNTSRRSWLTAALGAGATSALAAARPPSAVQGAARPIGDEGVGPDEVLGHRGFERIVEEVAGIERGLGIHDLASFTQTV